MSINNLFIKCLNSCNKSKEIDYYNNNYNNNYRTIKTILPSDNNTYNIINNNILIKFNNIIPKIIYKTGKENINNLSPYLNNIFKNILDNNKDFKLKYYDDNDCKNFIEKYYIKDVLDAYNKLKPGAYKADLFRYCILYINGGIYGDLSQIYHKPFIEFIDFDKNNLYIVEDTFHKPYYEKGIQISFIAAKPGLKIFKDVIYGIVENTKNNYYGYNTLDITGPYHFAKYLKGTDIKYTKDLYLTDNGNKICHKKTDEIIITSYHPKHRLNIKYNNYHYSYMWYNNNIYN